MFINDMKTPQDIFDAYMNSADDLCKIFEAIELSLDDYELRSNNESSLSYDEINELNAIKAVLGNILAYV